ncbi:DUF4194 domain-containing protein [Flagellimonas halotolerans]|uniref:DUF4194 domain-containing protein n=1 Tax=Flagellimonas halotolerans TaxID=3112164 RepID=A0ABU6IL06_9FLAO|nr:MULTISPECIES: DUF4194 domain-containing protein [unclassified Allomuricauda]MEC3963848.1 DUF4194 domain-containing protein [Muricauda sp. SYSU M86414]MEC4263718.1 DUF4194 domain-containing protein [Muricauda sp. SYSU M84420]
MEYQNDKIAPYARSAVKLLQGPVFEDQPDVWNEIIQYQVELIQYFEKISLELIIDKRDGYAYLKQIELDESGSTIGLVRRMPLTYDLTLVCVLLREWLLEFESNDLETTNLYITPKQFRDRMEMFFKEKANELKFIRDLNRHLDQCVEMGFLKLVHKDAAKSDENRYEVKRIIKARVTTEELSRFKKQLEDEQPKSI